MMTFGWRPRADCYSTATSTTGPASGASAPAVCTAVPAWFWVALGVAVIAGASHRSKRA
jgi:hypothetical protein